MMETVKQLLIAGDAAGALRAFAQLVKAEPARVGELIDDLAALLAREYQRFIIAPVHHFAREAAQALPADYSARIIAAARPLFERTQHWMRELEAVTRERLGREARSAITMNDLKLAARRGLALLKRARDEQDADRLARMLVEGMAGLIRDQDRTHRVLEAVFKESPVAFDWHGLFEDARARHMKSGLNAQGEKEWTKILGQACFAVRDFLPGREVGEPTPEQLAAFVGEASAILRAGMAGDDDLMIDALMLIHEYCPTDPSPIPSPAGVEPRLFLEISPRAKLTAVRGLAALGEIPALRARVNELAHGPNAAGRAALLCTVMGGLRHDDFFSYLRSTLPHMETAKQQEAVVEAMSRLSHPEGPEIILEELARCLKKALDPAEGRRAKMLLTALGRVNRARTIEPHERNRLVAQTIALMQKQDNDLTSFAALQLFSNRTEELSHEARVWAVKQLVTAIFSADRGQDLQLAQQSPLGSRAPLVAGLERLGPEMLPEILLAAESHAMKYSAAFQAVGELLGRTPDPRAIGLLHRMILTTFNHALDPSKGSYLTREKVKDAATGEMKEISREEILHTLLHALSQIEDEKAKQLLLEIADQVQSGQFANPGTGAASLLFDAKRRSGSLGKISAHAAPAEEIDEGDFNAALKDARGGMFTKPAKQIGAFVVLARSRRPEAMGAIAHGLGAKDRTVAMAAETALHQIISPPPDPQTFEEMMENLFAEEDALKGSGERFLELVRKNFPKRPPYDLIIRRAAQGQISDGAFAHRVNGAIRIDEVAEARVSVPGEEQGAGDAGAHGGDALEAPAHINELERKRRHMLARQAWARGGKKGPEPKME